MAAYYTGNAEYRDRAPPPAAVRLLGRFFVLLTILLFASGTVLITGPRRLHDDALIVHKASFYLWLLTLLVHLAAHLRDAARLAPADLRHTGDQAPGSRRRHAGVATSVLLGGLLAASLNHHIHAHLTHW